MSRASIQQVTNAIRQGRCSARQNVEAAIRRHEESDLGAYICFDAAGARKQADQTDAKVKRGDDPGPLAGITVSVKDLYGVEGLPIQAGTKRELPVRWRTEGFLVQSLRSLGAVIMGKTHTVELAFGGVGLNYNTGTPLNPWDSEEHRGPGGSSAGAGVSLWEGSAQLALGSDTGGSVRIPASATGVVGHRHTTGRWPTTGVVPLSSTLDTVGLLTRTAADMRYAFGLIDRLAGPGGGEEATNSGTSGGLGVGSDRRRRAAGAMLPAGAATAALAGLRIGIPRSSYMWERADPAIVAVVRRALADVEEAGAVLLDADVPELDEAGASYLSGELVSPECKEFLERELPEWTDILDPTVGKRLESAHDIGAVRYVALLGLRRRLSAGVHARLDALRVDLLAVPTLPVAPPILSTLAELEAYWEVNRRMLSGTAPASMLDMCAVTLPAGLDQYGMPAGLQLIGRAGADAALLDRAVAVESALGTNVDRLGTPPRLARDARGTRCPGRLSGDGNGSRTELPSVG